MKNLLLTILLIAPTTSRSMNYLKRFASFTDKAVALWCISYPTYASHAEHKKLMATAHPLRADIAEPTQRMVSDLCKKLDVDYKNIEIKQLSNNYDAAAANSLFSKNKVIIGDAFLNRPLYQQEAIMAHELIHIKNRDNLNVRGAAAIISLGAIGSFRLGHHVLTKFATLAQKTASHYNFNTLTNTIDKIKNIALTPLKSLSLPLAGAYHPQLKGTTASYEYDDEDFSHISKTNLDDGEKTAGIGLLLLARYQRFYEKRADIESAKKAAIAQGAIDAFETILQKDDASASSTSKYRYTAALDTHPCLKERIEYLKPLVQQGK